MKLDIADLRKQALIFTPGRLVAIITVMVLIAMVLLMALGEDMGTTFYALLLLMPCAIVALLLDVFLRIVFRKDVKRKVLYIWVIEIVAMVIGFRAFLLA